MRILELGEAATTDQIKRAYRQLVQQNHPDKHKGDESARKKFIKIS
ncbi:MAG: DnaJ domain-containing protein, partial [Planctomycetota bacterium]